MTDNVDAADSERRMVMAFKGDDPSDPPAAPGVACPACGHRFMPGQTGQVREVDPAESKREMLAGFAGEDREAPAAPGVDCPACSHRFVPGAAKRVTESAPVATRRTEYADDARTWPLDTEEHVRAAWAHWGSDQVDASTSTAERARVRSALHRLDIAAPANSVSEALINGVRSWDDHRELVRRAIRASVADYDGYCWVSILDINDTDVVYLVGSDELHQAPYSIAGDVVTLGSAVRVERSYSPSTTTEPEPVGETVTERARIQGGARVLEAKGTDATGHRIFRVQVIVPGDSLNGRRYPESVLRKAVPKYEGAKAFDHHRTETEMSTGTIQGLCGYLRNTAAGAGGEVEADLYVLPSATLVAEALDAALALATQDPDAAPLVGISHDVLATFQPIREGAVQLQEATSIDRVFSADVVSDPAAGGRPTRVVAGGIDPTSTSTREGTDMAPTTEETLAALAAASPEQLAAIGLTKTAPATETAPAKTAKTAETTEVVETVPKGTWLGKAMIEGKFKETSLPPIMLAGFVDSLPEQVSEAVVDQSIKTLLDVLALGERGNLVSKVAVTKEAVDKKIEALEAFFQQDYANGYRSLKRAWQDFTGYRESAWGEEDPNAVMIRESMGGLNYDSVGRRKRASEALTSLSWDVVLGDTIHRQMIKYWSEPDLQAWRLLVSAITAPTDFRNNVRGRVGGYGLLPIVGEQAPYQPLTSPTDEAAVYKVVKRGGTESLTLEMIANDDMAAIQNIPRALGRAAAITLYRYVFDMLSSNVVCTYDSTALFHANHANTDGSPAVLNDDGLAAARLKMTQQTAYNDEYNYIGPTPATLFVPPSLERMAYWLTKSQVAVPATPAGASDIPNFHSGLDFKVVKYWTGTTWFLAASPNDAPLIEMGFYRGQVEPELFTQADPTVGSMFNTDSVTYKIRHIYAGTPLDHRGLQRAVNA